MLKDKFNGTPIQLCVFHKCTRVNQWVPFVRPKTKLDHEIKERVEKILFAETKNAALTALQELQHSPVKTKVTKLLYSIDIVECGVVHG